MREKSTSSGLRLERTRFCHDPVDMWLAAKTTQEKLDDYLGRRSWTTTGPIGLCSVTPTSRGVRRGRVSGTQSNEVGRPTAARATRAGRRLWNLPVGRHRPNALLTPQTVEDCLWRSREIDRETSARIGSKHPDGAVVLTGGRRGRRRDLVD